MKSRWFKFKVGVGKLLCWLACHDWVWLRRIYQGRQVAVCRRCGKWK